MAEQAARKVLYGSHPYSRTDTGEVWDVNSMTLEQAQNWYQQFARPDSASLIFAGDINEPEAVGFAKKYFGNWKAGSKPPEVNLPPIPQIKSRRIFLVDNPGVQSRIRLGQHGITRRDPDYFTSRVVSDYFGFGFNSRLNTSVRVAQGLTYGIWGGYLSKRFAGEFMIDTFTKTNTTAQAVKAVLDQVQQLQDVPPTNDEVAKSKSYIVGSFWERRETPQQLAEDLWLVQSNRLDPDYFNQLLTGVSKTQPSDCTKLVKKTVDPNQTAIVVVGNASAVKAELEKIAPVSMLSLQEPNEPRK
jgi:zinc protease